jgi:hypothetical protein
VLLVGLHPQAQVAQAPWDQLVYFVVAVVVVEELEKRRMVALVQVLPAAAELYLLVVVVVVEVAVPQIILVHLVFLKEVEQEGLLPAVLRVEEREIQLLVETVH